MKQIILILLASVLHFTSYSQNEANPALPDDSSSASLIELKYESSEEAAAKWLPMGGSPTVEILKPGPRQALRFPCCFSENKGPRASWDHSEKFELSNSSGIEFRFFSRDVTPVSHFTFYFHSGNGWYSANFYPEQTGEWTNIRIAKTEFSADNVSGWSAIDAIRISAWRANDKDCEFLLADFRSIESPATGTLLLLNESAAKSKSSVREHAKAMAGVLGELGVPFTPMSDFDLLPERLEGVKLLILPFCPSIQNEKIVFLKEYLANGGKLLSFYLLPQELSQTAGFSAGEFVKPENDGEFSSIRPAKNCPLKGIPQNTPQHSWNIMDMKPANSKARIAAYWYNEEGEPTPYVALLVSSNAVHMTHVLLRDGGLEKRKLLLSMISWLLPDVLEKAAKHSLEQTGLPGNFKSFAEAVNHVRGIAAGNKLTIPPELAEASLGAENAASMIENGNFREAIAESSVAREKLVEAYCKAQAPQMGERRMVWCHNPLGLPGKSWDETVRLLADNGFSDLLPNMLYGGASWHPSKLLPAAPELDAHGDLTKECLAACRKHGIKCHVWKVCWKLGSSAPASFIAELKKEGRLQTSLNGSENGLWLCPSNPQNQELEIKSLLEVVQNYDVDGIHFDYIRYPGPESCFCEGCRARFEDLLQAPVENWPKDLLEKPELKTQWLQFRRDQITKVVAETSKGARKLKANIQISAAVFRNASRDRDEIAQDWQLWCREGYLDFVCPMDYSSSATQFSNWVEAQLKDAAPVPCYPGIGLSTWADQDNAPRLIEQILITRKLKTGGFSIFELNPNSASTVFPLCGRGITKKKAASTRK